MPSRSVSPSSNPAAPPSSGPGSIVLESPHSAFGRDTASITSISLEARTLLGISPDGDSLPLDALLGHLDPEDADQLLNQLGRAASSNGFQMLVRALTPGAAPRRVSLHASPPESVAGGWRLHCIVQECVDDSLLFAELEAVRANLASARAIATSNEFRLRGILAALPDIVTILDRAGHVVDVHVPPLAAAGPGPLPAIRAGRRIDEVWPAPTSRVVYLLLSKVLETGARETSYLEIPHEGKRLVYECHFAPCGRDHVIALWRDTTESLSAYREVEQMRMRLDIALESGHVGLWDWDIERESVLVDGRTAGLLGRPIRPLDVPIQELCDLLLFDEREGINSTLSRFLNGELDSLALELALAAHGGGTRWLQARGKIVVWSPGGRPRRAAGSVVDVTEARELIERLSHALLFDHLTGLPNRTNFERQLAASAPPAEEWQTPPQLAVLLIAFARLQKINESHGHAEGDAVLRQIGERLKAILPPSALLARFTGNSFAVLLRGNVAPGDATRSAERIIAQFETPIRGSLDEAFLQPAIGIVVRAMGESEPGALLRDADAALARAKRNAAVPIALFGPAMHEAARAELELITALRHAIDSRELTLHYQPIVDVSTGKLDGLEALLRWVHPRLGNVSPARFIPLAEESSLIFPIGEWALREACGQMAAWRRSIPEAEALTISVNVSPRQLLAPGFLSTVEGALHDTQLPSSALNLEVTEGSFIDDPDRAAAILGRLRGLGIGIHLDDFGTGYSGLGWLQRFPVDVVKIDRSFIMGCDTEEDRMRFVTAILSMCAVLSLSVVAEGVETIAQLLMLGGLSCPRAQGYFLSRPLSAEAATELIESHPTWPTAATHGATA